MLNKSLKIATLFIAMGSQSFVWADSVAHSHLRMIKQLVYEVSVARSDEDKIDKRREIEAYRNKLKALPLDQLSATEWFEAGLQAWYNQQTPKGCEKKFFPET
jgi:hypothetical protein